MLKMDKIIRVLAQIRNVIMLIACLGFAVIALLLVVTRITPEIQQAALVVLILCGSCAVMSIWQMAGTCPHSVIIDQDAYVIGTNRRRYVPPLICCLGFVVSGTLLILTHPELQEKLWGALIFCGAGVLILIWKIADRRSGLVIDSNGLHSLNSKVGTIPWVDIAGAYVKSIQQQTFICLRFHDESKYISKLSAVDKVCLATVTNMGFTTVSINVTDLDADANQVCDLIVKRTAH